MIQETDIYRKLQQHLDEMPIGWPPTESGIEIKILKHLFTPKHTEIALKLKFDFEPIEVIHKRFEEGEITSQELEKHLDDMVTAGVLNFKRENGEKLYGNALLLVGIYEYQINNLTKEFLEDISQYSDEGFDKEFFSTKISQFRIIPVEKSLTPETQIPTYEEIEKLVEMAEEPVVLSDCVCRKGKAIRGKTCLTTARLKTCLGFGHIAQLAIDQGWGEQISKAEAMELLKLNQEEGLVFEVANTTKEPYFICSCCTCCCGMLSDFKNLPRPTEFVHTNFYAEVDPDACMSCQTCIERCPMNAIKMRKGIAKVLERKCIGCGNCVPVCPEEAIKLIRKEDEHIPPETLDELYDNILAKKLEIREKNKK